MEAKQEFTDFRDAVLCALDNNEIPYKLFGGAVIALLDGSRITYDIDIALPRKEEFAEKIIDALYSIGFCEMREKIAIQIYGINDDWKGVEEESTLQLESDRKGWEEYHIDLCFNLGEHNYDTMPSIDFKTDTMTLTIVEPAHIAVMKANIFPKPREKDIEDIMTIKKYLGVDDEANVEKSKGFFDKFFKKSKPKGEKENG